MLARPVYVHTEHIARMDCPNGCLGVELSWHKDLHAEHHRGCAICQVDAKGPIPAGTRTLRHCPHRLCQGRFHQSSYDEFYVAERLASVKQKVAGLLHRSAA